MRVNHPAVEPVLDFDLVVGTAETMKELAWLEVYGLGDGQGLS